ncbi:hypothetical protein A2U01_0067182, partial [Trifolium medium]|nr:hypothetical protein [Trifolium medium]
GVVGYCTRSVLAVSSFIDYYTSD